MRFFQSDRSRVTVFIERIQADWGNPDSQFPGGPIEISFFGPTYITDSDYHGCKAALHFVPKGMLPRKQNSEESLGSATVPTSRSDTLIAYVQYDPAKLSEILAFCHTVQQQRTDAEIRFDCRPNGGDDIKIDSVWAQISHQKPKSTSVNDMDLNQP